MITPYIFVACEKAILSKENTASLIALFTKIVVNSPAEAEIPKDAVVPKEWAIFSMWNTESEESNRNYMVCTEILYPDETRFSDIPKVKMSLETGKKAQVGIQVQGFPIGQDGPYTIRTWIEENEERIAGPIEFKLEVEINRLQKANTDEAGEKSSTKN